MAMAKQIKWKETNYLQEHVYPFLYVSILILLNGKGAPIFTHLKWEFYISSYVTQNSNPRS